MNLIKELFNKYFWIAVFVIIIFEILSFLGYLYEPVNTIFFFIILIFTLIICFFKPEAGIYIILAELSIGSKGYLFSFELEGFSISIRLALFLLIFFIWLVKLISQRKITFFKSKNWPYFLILFAFIGIGIIVGLIKDNPLDFIFFNVNGYLFLGLLLPIWQFINNQKKIINCIRVIFAGILAVSIKVFLLLFVFSHQIMDWIQPLYRWVRETGVGEITVLENGLVRIFFQSHIFHLFGFFILFYFLFKKYKLMKKSEIVLLTFFLIIISSNLIISYSRSFWLAWIIGLVILYIFIWLVLKNKFKKVFISGLFILLIILFGLGLEILIINIPIFGSGGGLSINDVINSERMTNLSEEPALQSRFELLTPLLDKNIENPIIGGGMGSSVTYATEDLRYIDMHAGDNMYTTYDFEWAYLGMWLNLGIFGLIASMLVIYKILKIGWKNFKRNIKNESNLIIFGMFISLIVLIIVNFSTPYLNHPLGISIIILIAITFEKLNTKQETYGK